MSFRCLAIWPALLMGLVCLEAGLVARADEASITVDLAHPGGPISPTLYGIFFEEINHAGDGGLYAEMVRNRSFEDAQGLSSWSAVADGAATAKLALNTDSPLNSKNPQSLKLEASGTDTGRAGVANAGYWGMAVTKGHSYALSLYARREGAGPETLVVTLEAPSGDILAKGRVSGVGTEWKQFSCKLAAKEGAADARLVISATTDGAVLLDQVSLFPKRTWKGRENGLRLDLGNLVADLAPAFVRFPGGCFVEGDQLANASRWKESVGDPAARPGHWNLWGYRSTDGLGYHEFLRMCEDLGSEPLFVINCGMAHGGVVPMDQLEAWVQDALDALEYAIGPVTSTWGAQRARNGHPKPFTLRYMEIGNENGWGDTLPLYEERYARFYDAIKAIYPSVKLVANVPVRNRPMDLVDDHYYNSPEWFAGNVGRYDKQDRKGPKVYVGEYAVTSGCGQGNLRAALAEAAFMMGLERNSDIIEMASYAPLFVNVADRKWNPDAIVFDSATSFGTPSYHVQKLFARNRPDLLLPSSVTAANAKPKVYTGAVGVGTWSTQAEFKDLKVTQGDRVLAEADLSGEGRGLRLGEGAWEVADGALRQTGDGDGTRAEFGDPAWGDYTFSLKARKTGGREGFLVHFHVKDPNNWFWWNVGGWGDTRHGIERSDGGSKQEIASASGHIETGRWYDLRVEVAGSRIRCYLDGTLVHEVSDPGSPSLVGIAGLSSKSGEVVLKVVNLSDEPKDTAVELRGAGRVAPEAKAIVLSGRPLDENSLATPLKVAPTTSTVTGIGPSFRHTFPPYSLTLLRLKASP